MVGRSEAGGTRERKRERDMAERSFPVTSERERERARGVRTQADDLATERRLANLLEERTPSSLELCERRRRRRRRRLCDLGRPVPSLGVLRGELSEARTTACSGGAPTLKETPVFRASASFAVRLLCAFAPNTRAGRGCAERSARRPAAGSRGGAARGDGTARDGRAQNPRLLSKARRGERESSWGGGALKRRTRLFKSFARIGPFPSSSSSSSLERTRRARDVNLGEPERPPRSAQRFVPVTSGRDRRRRGARRRQRPSLRGVCRAYDERKREEGVFFFFFFFFSVSTPEKSLESFSSFFFFFFE